MYTLTQTLTVTSDVNLQLSCVTKNDSLKLVDGLDILPIWVKIQFQRRYVNIFLVKAMLYGKKIIYVLQNDMNFEASRSVSLRILVPKGTSTLKIETTQSWR